MPRKDLILSLYEGEQHIGRRHCNQRHPSSREGCPWLQWRLPMCSIGSIRLASSLSSLCECTAFASCCMSSTSLRSARIFVGQNEEFGTALLPSASIHVNVRLELQFVY